MVTLSNDLWGFVLSFTEAQGRGRGSDADSGLRIEARS